jgi:hypothetical protein
MKLLKGIWYASISALVTAIMFFGGFFISVVWSVLSLVASVGLTILTVFCIIKASVDDPDESLK